jgi:hypothetical protein
MCSHNSDPAANLRQKSNTRPHTGSNPSTLRLHTPHSQRSERAYTRQHTPAVNQNRLSVFCPNPACAALLLLCLCSFLSFSLSLSLSLSLPPSSSFASFVGSPILLRACVSASFVFEGFHHEVTNSALPVLCILLTLQSRCCCCLIVCCGMVQFPCRLFCGGFLFFCQ